jgi:hypothetical protein
MFDISLDLQPEAVTQIVAESSNDIELVPSSEEKLNNRAELQPVGRSDNPWPEQKVYPMPEPSLGQSIWDAVLDDFGNQAAMVLPRREGLKVNPFTGYVLTKPEEQDAAFGLLLNMGGGINTGLTTSRITLRAFWNAAVDRTSAAVELLDDVKQYWRRVAPNSKLTYSTGAREISADEYLKRERWAIDQYASFRTSTSDVTQITSNLGVPEFQVQRVKDHLFFNEHTFRSGEVMRFDPDADIAESWIRLQQGTQTADDLKLFKHEYFESRFEAIFRTDYGTAHDKTKIRYPSPLDN